MKKLLLFSIASIVLGIFNISAQIQIDKQIQLTGTGNDARITGLDSVGGNGKDAVNVTSIQNGKLIYATAGGTANALTVTLNPPVTAYQVGMVVNFISNQAITGPTTLNVNSVGVKTIKKYYNQDLQGCEIQNGQVVTVVFDGSNFQLTSVFNTAPPPGGAISGTASVCPGQSGVSYSVPVIAGATVYNWSYSGTGATISGSTNSISISFSSGATSGNLSVFGTNGCGSGLVSANFPITIGTSVVAAVTNGLVGYWPMEGNSHDTTGNGDNGTDLNATYGTAYGKYAQSVSFSGNGYIDLGIGTTLKVSSLTASAWIKTTITDGNQYIIIAKMSSSAGGHFAYLTSFINGVIYTRIEYANNTYLDFNTGTSAVNDGNWHLVTLTYAGGNGYLYIDGVQRGSASAGSSIYYEQDYNASIGAALDGGSWYGLVTGFIDDARIYNRALSTAEVQTLYAITCP